MKNLFLFAVSVILISVNTVNAQWSLSGNGSTNPPTDFLGTTDAKNLVIKTNATERLSILSTGEVRINSLNASSLVFTDADKNLSSSGMVPVANGGTGATTLTGVLIGNGTNAVTAITGQNYNVPIWDNNTLTNSLIYSNGWNVGIGTNSPNNNLQIHNTSYDKGAVGKTVLQLTNNNSGIGETKGLLIKLGETGFLSNAYIWNAEAGDLSFGTNNLSRMSIGSDGKVIVGSAFLNSTAIFQVDGSTVINGNLGLGVLDPSERLAVHGAINLSLIDPYDAANGSIIFDGDFKGRINGSWVSLTAGGENYWLLDINNNIYTSNRNVGINTSPLTSLHVKNIINSTPTSLRLEKTSEFLEPVIIDLINTGAEFKINYQNNDLLKINTANTTITNQLIIDRPNTTTPDISITKNGNDYYPLIRLENSFDNGGGGSGDDIINTAFDIYNQSGALNFRANNGSALVSLLSNGLTINTAQTNNYDLTVLGRIGVNTTPYGENALTVKGEIILNNSNNATTVKLYSDGKIWVKSDVKIQEINDWGDFVFAPGYKLMSLSEIEAYIKDKGHLPGLPSAAEVKANGINVGEMTNTLTQKIEEMTLLMIEMNKKIEKLEKENEELKSGRVDK